MVRRSALIMAAAAVATTLVSADEFLGPRNLQALPPPPPPTPPPTPASPAYTATRTPLKYYGDDIKNITYNANLGCGACITGGFTYCVLGKEGDDYSGKIVAQKCCTSATAQACPEINDSTWTCSSKYSDTILAKNICPYSKAKCGGSGQAYRFTTWGDSTKNTLSYNITNGETCSYIITTECGVPSFTVNSDTTGLSIETVDYTDDETSRRMLWGEDEDEMLNIDDDFFAEELHTTSF